MKIVDPGHVYELSWLDVEPGLSADAIEGVGANLLTFVKREGSGYPGNSGHHPGTTIQEVLRALIDRIKYLDNQVFDSRNEVVLGCFRNAIWLLEARAAERHGRKLLVDKVLYHSVENFAVCPKCLHIGCKGSCHPDIVV